MKKLILRLLLVLFATTVVTAQKNSDFPGKTWKKYADVTQGGWSKEKLEIAKKYYDSISASSFMVVDKKGRVVVAWGEYEREFIIHSCRKSFISALYGVYSDRGKINLNKTLGELGITSSANLTDVEKTAKTIDLLKARSGVYIPAAAEAPGMTRSRPKRGSHKPNEFWYYNNWDFNVLGTILKNETGLDVFEAMKKEIAVPLQMQDFEINDGFFATGNQNQYDHPAYVMKMSAVDMARFGLLYLNEGKWKNKQVISKKWVKESVIPYSTEMGMYGRSDFGGYGYLWWLDKAIKNEKMYSAAGAGGHFISVLPKNELVFVQRVNTYDRNRVSSSEKTKLYKLILAAKTGKPSKKAKLVDLEPQPIEYKVSKLTEKALKEYVHTFNFNENNATVSLKDNNLIFTSPFSPFENPKLIPLKEKDSFLIEDFLIPVKFSRDNNGNIKEVTVTLGGGRQFVGKAASK